MADTNRSFNGELKLLEKKNEFLYDVEVYALNDCTNRNGWKYTNMSGNKNQFCGTPLLCAYVNGGKTIGDGHNFDNGIDPETGQAVPTFTGNNAERIVGAVSDNPDDIRVESINGCNWIVCKATLWTWYAREAVAKIKKDSAEGKPMSVSIETLVSKWHMDGDTEVEDEYTVLGTTILGDGVAPAVEDARIMTLSEITSEFEQLKLRAASYIGNKCDECPDDGDCDDCDDCDDDDCDGKDCGCGNDCKCEGECGDCECKNEESGDDCGCNEKGCGDDGIIDESDEVPDETENKPQNINKGVNKTMTLSKKQCAELAKKFDGYTVLAALQMEDKSIRVCLMSKEGETAVYHMESMDEVVTPSKITKQNAQVCFSFGEDNVMVDTAELTDRLSAEVISLNSALENANNELTEAKETISAMLSAENSRRLSAAKASAKGALEAFNANRADKVEEAILDSINADIDNGLYTNSVDAEGNWTGEAEVEDKVLALCAKAVMALDKKAVEKNNSVFIWQKGSEGKADDGSIGALLSSFNMTND